MIGSLVESARILPPRGPGDSNGDADSLGGAGERPQFAELVSLAMEGEKRAFLISRRRCFFSGFLRNGACY